MKKNVIVLCNDTGANQHGWLKASEFPDAILHNLWGKCGDSSQELDAWPRLITEWLKIEV